ncbi:MAG: hypothetical protein AAF403_08365, partial [Pseudomonadota bacterium]
DVALGLFGCIIGREVEDYQSIKEHACRVANGTAELYKTLAKESNSEGQYLQAIQYYENAVEKGYDAAKASYNCSFLYLLSGAFEKGWKAYENRWHSPKVKFFQWRHVDLPFWENQDIRGKKLLIWAEQGIGDEIMFASQLPHIAKQCEVYITCDQRLEGWFQHSLDVHVLKGARNNPSEVINKLGVSFDYQLAMGSLPLKTGLGYHQHVAPVAAYLKADFEHVKRLKSFLKERFPNKIYVGVCWVRNTKYYGSNTQINPDETLLKQLNRKHIQLVNLQVKMDKDKLLDIKQRLGVDIYAFEDIDLFSDFQSTAALTKALDYVVAVPQTIVHVAGSVGAKVLLLLRQPCKWRWSPTLLDRSLWYPHPQFTILRAPLKASLDGVIAQAISMVEDQKDNF